MKIAKLLTVVVVTLLIVLPVTVDSAGAAEKVSLGEQLERQMWKDMKAKNWDAVEKKIAPGFQSAHQDGTRIREAEIALIKGLNLGEYELTNFVVTQNGSVINVTYFVSVAETIDGKRLSSKPAVRLSTWLKTDGRWQWIAHANLKPLQ